MYQKEYIIDSLEKTGSKPVHMTDFVHLNGILNSGYLGSRSEFGANREDGGYAPDYADKEVLTNTQQHVEQCARLYFKPGTPPMYRFIKNNYR